METLEPRPPRGDCPELTEAATRAAQRMLEDALRQILDHHAKLIAPAEPTHPPPHINLPDGGTAAAWLDNRRPGRYRSRRGPTA